MEMKRRCVVGAMMMIVLEGFGDYAIAQPAPRKQENQVTTESKFYCNTKALNPTERARRKQLTEKLVSRRTRIVETEKGYEFQYSPATISLAELAEWTLAESKCCPFFDFHIDLENEGALLCLRLTGEKGVKAFIKAEHLVPSDTSN
jgi:hypothetical protein